jgi:hypothetical protein
VFACDSPSFPAVKHPSKMAFKWVTTTTYSCIAFKYVTFFIDKVSFGHFLSFYEVRDSCMNSCHISLVMHYIRAFLIMSCTVIVHMLRNVSPVTLPCCSYRRRKYTELSERWSSENLIFYQTMWKKPVRPHANIIRRMQDTEGYWHTLIICNTYCFSTAIVVTRTRQLLRTLLVLVALPLVSVAVRRTAPADPQNNRTENVFTCVLHNEASNTSAWYVPII